jgi:multidrug efflux pump subunit AcrA (membrane-fusion protein)
MSPEASREPVVHTPPPAPAPRLRAVLIAIAVVAVLAAALGIVSRVRARTALKDETRATAAPTVAIVKPEPGAPAQELILPASVQAFTDAPIYARTSGYLKKWYADIGARVRKGQRLADIDSPEIEQQLQAARADLANARANEHLAKAPTATSSLSGPTRPRAWTSTTPWTASRPSTRPRTPRSPTCGGWSRWWRSRRSTRRSTGSSPRATPTSGS